MRSTLTIEGGIKKDFAADLNFCLQLKKTLQSHMKPLDK